MTAGPEFEDVSVDFAGLTAWLANIGVIIRPSPESADYLIHQRGQSFLLNKEFKEFCPKAWMLKVLKDMIESFNLRHSAEPDWALIIERIFLEQALVRKTGPTLIVRARFGFQPFGYTWAGPARFPTDLEFGDPDNWRRV